MTRSTWCSFGLGSGRKVVHETVLCAANPCEAHRTGLGHAELVKRINDDANLGACIDPLNTRHHDKEEVWSAHRTPYLWFV